MRLFLLICLLWPAAANASEKCVVLLHGLARTEASFSVMEQVFKWEGYHVVRPGYPSTDQPIEDLARLTMEPAIEACGDRQINFVAHSMGGILIRYWFQDHKPENLGRVVMLGTPNQGSQLVDELDNLEAFGWLNGPAGKQLGTGPESLPKSLPAVDYPVGVIAGTSTLNLIFSSMIDGEDDGKVSVASTRVDGMADHLVLPVTHTFMMNNPQVIAESLHFIEEGRFARDITWSDAVLGTIEKACEGTECEGAAKWIKEEADR